MEQVASGLHSCFGGQEQEGRLVSCELQDSRPVALTRQALRWWRAPRRPRPSTTPHAKHWKCVLTHLLQLLHGQCDRGVKVMD